MKEQRAIILLFAVTMLVVFNVSLQIMHRGWDADSSSYELENVDPGTSAIPNGKSESGRSSEGSQPSSPDGVTTATPNGGQVPGAAAADTVSGATSVAGSPSGGNTAADTLTSATTQVNPSPAAAPAPDTTTGPTPATTPTPTPAPAPDTTTGPTPQPTPSPAPSTTPTTQPKKDDEGDRGDDAASGTVGIVPGGAILASIAALAILPANFTGQLYQSLLLEFSAIRAIEGLKAKATLLARRKE
ncbi:MAG TPA: hypothetical protein VIK22_06345 [Candidatus Anoxymicrobiaceae bacterium]